jgi:AraC family transcriptional regulator of adaptative response/methylated-DNA-[protein]-cysteine methyltransferase
MLRYKGGMLFTLPDDKTLYGALLERDPSFDGRAYVGVSSTGIFCRLTCPARKPKFENCQFFDTVPKCVEAGFRPCKRCKPLGAEADSEPAIQELLTALEANPEYRWYEEDITARGYDPSTIRRLFKRHFGTTFLAMARQARLRASLTTLNEGGRVIDAQLDAGFSSASAFRTAFAKLLGVAPANLAKDAMLKADWIKTPLGDMVAVSDKNCLHLLEFSDRKALPAELKKLRDMVKGDIGLGRYGATDQVERELQLFFGGECERFETPLAMHGSDFTKSVWRALRDIPAGVTRSYSNLATQIGRPSATRAVARANGANQIAILIPCHRVIGADGSLTGYGGGLWRKQKLIEIEQTYAAKRIENGNSG